MILEKLIIRSCYRLERNREKGRESKRGRRGPLLANLSLSLFIFDLINVQFAFFITKKPFNHQDF